MKMTTLMMAVVILIMAKKGSFNIVHCLLYIVATKNNYELIIGLKMNQKGNFVKRLKSIVILSRTLLKEWVL